MPPRSNSRIQPLILEGTAYQRGLVHGETLRAEIRELVQVWKADLQAALNHDADQVIQRFLQQTDFTSAIRQWTPDLLEEVRGIADGSGLAYDTVLAFQLVDELWANAIVVEQGNCTSMGFRAGERGPACLAQNIDVEILRDSHQVVLHIKHQDSDLESFVVSCAGVIGFNGMNNHAVGVCCNALLPLNSRRDGLPVACIVRGLLEQPTVEDAQAFLQRLPHACGQNYIVGGPSQVVDLECSANKVSLYEPAGWDGIVWHTNLPLVNDDYTPAYREGLDRQEKSPFTDNNMVRFQSVEQRLQRLSSGTRLEWIKETLASRDSVEHPICASKDEREFFAQIGIFSFASTIMVLSADPVLDVTFTPLDPSSYTELTFGGGVT